MDHDESRTSTPEVRRAIVGAARALLEVRGVEEAVTLRAVARGAGITAPSIYNHFPDLTAVLDAALEQAFAEYEAARTAATAGIDDPLERIRVGAQAHLRFAHRQPAAYRMLFARHRPRSLPVVADRAATAYRVLIDTIARCVPHGRPEGADAAADALELWMALHGLADLPPAHPRFPWPPEDELVDRLLRHLVLHDPHD